MASRFLGGKAGKRPLYTHISERQRNLHNDRYSKERVVAVGKVSRFLHPECKLVFLSFNLRLPLHCPG